MDENPKEPMKVVDRRLFTRDGERRPEGVPAADPEPDLGARAAAPAEDRQGPQSRGSEATPFSEFLMSLAIPGFMSLGQIPDPLTGRAAVNLEDAARAIDLLQLIQEKTRGNLAPSEEGILTQILQQLKFLYIQTRKGPAPE